MGEAEHDGGDVFVWMKRRQFLILAMILFVSAVAVTATL